MRTFLTVLQHFLAPMHISFYDNLSVASGSKMPSGCFELLSYFIKIIYFAVVYDDARAVRAHHRLVAMLHVYDTEPSMTEPNTVGDILASRIRTPVDDRVHHSFDRLWLHPILTRWRRHYSADTTHFTYSGDGNVCTQSDSHCTILGGSSGRFSRITAIL